MKFTHTILAKSIVAIAAGLVSITGYAQGYPTKPVKIIVPFSPGGGNDALGRIIATKFSELTGQQFIVDNRPGAGGNIGASVVAAAAADGYTLLMASNQVIINPSLYTKIGFDVMKDLTPVANIANVQFLLVAHPNTKIKTVTGLIESDKRMPGSLNHGTPGNGTPQHLAAELFNRMAHTSLTHIPYKGTGPAIADLLGGQLQIAFATLPSVAQYVKSGRVTPLAVTGNTPSHLFPEVPTVAKAGVPGYEASTWYGLLAPAGTPKPLLDTLQKLVQRALSEPEFRKKVEEQGFEPAFMDGASMRTMMKSDFSKWAAIVKSANVKLD